MHRSSREGRRGIAWRVCAAAAAAIVVALVGAAGAAAWPGTIELSSQPRAVAATAPPGVDLRHRARHQRRHVGRRHAVVPKPVRGPGRHQQPGGVPPAGPPPGSPAALPDAGQPEPQANPTPAAQAPLSPVDGGAAPPPAQTGAHPGPGAEEPTPGEGEPNPPAGEEPEPPAGEEPNPPAGEEPEPPAGEEPNPPAGEEPEPPAGEEPEPPAGEPNPPAGEEPNPPAGEEPEPPAGEEPNPPAGGEPEPPAEEPEPPVSEEPNPPAGEEPEPPAGEEPNPPSGEPESPDPGDLLFRGRSIDDFAMVQAAPRAITEVPDPLGSGQTVLRMTVDDDDVAPVTPTENPRAQLISPDLIRRGDEFWLKTKFLIPQNFPTVTGWLSLLSIYGPPFNASSPWQIEVIGDHLQWTRNRTYGFDVPWQAPLTKGAWVTVLTHERFAADGFVEMWIDGQPVSFFGRETRLEMQTMDDSNDGGLNSVRIAQYRQVGMFQTASVYFGPLLLGATRAAVGG